MTQITPADPVQIDNPTGRSAAVLVCEHASCNIPAALAGLGLSQDARQSHAAWDPGALAVAQRMSQRLDAVLVSSTVSRLVYDCNRPPSAPDAMPAKSEVFDVPGNVGLTQAARDARTNAYYLPFQTALAAQIAKMHAPIIVTIHSFTPVYHGQARAVEIGVLHDDDTRLADAMLETAAAHTSALVLRNDPYGPENGVTHTLREHALPGGHLNVMLEVRNDLIATPATQTAMGDMIAAWVADSVSQITDQGAVQCVA
ncbi:Predicted N-formylglutamate amidohydrolase [Yoonia tamlensis]|uniref:Predicted N-formylglutamate amidohydrolase n=1 Tax=Yoonia tamlensis TaxID=390270 RepID=A0A1I6I1Z4_9RHOB|nr:N-formylglutamate amidohydrolase [Yoonia tamlensis]SFR60679.1 Predicted N-formylglutamate amidohydrolase [Yoonia tamlensis]